jgi:hypothetical protein
MLSITNLAILPLQCSPSYFATLRLFLHCRASAKCAPEILSAVGGER